MNDCGLSEKTVLKIWGVFAQYAEVEKAILYGSRAMGNYKKGSDIDLTLEGDKLTDSIRGKIDRDLDDLSLPYGIDLSVFAHLNHAKFRDHIERVGVVFYDKSTDKKKVGWKMVKLGDVAKLGDVCLARRGTTITKKQTVDGDIPVIAGGIKPAYFHNQANRNANVTTVSSSGNAGFVNYWDMPIFASDCITIEPKDETQDRKFIFYYLLSQQQYIYDNFRSGAAQQHVYAKDIVTLSYPIIPINHQRKIVAKLDTISAEIETAIVVARQKRIEIANLKAAALSTFFSPNDNEWDTVKLGDVCELLYGKALPTTERVGADGIPAFGANGIKTFAKKALYEKPSIIIGRKGSAGEINKVSMPFWALDVAYYVVHDENFIELSFLYYMLTLKNLPSMARGVKPGINRNDVYSIKISLPPLDQQQLIVAKLDTIFAEADTADHATQVAEQNYTALKKAILTEVFDKTSEAI